MSDVQLAQLIGELTVRGLTIATAESLTGGGLVARLVDVPGASHVVRGGACTYAVDTKASVLGVSESQLAATGSGGRAGRSPDGSRGALAVRCGYRPVNDGVAGPGPADGFEAGTVHIACAHPTGEEHRLLHLGGDRAAVRAGAIGAALALVRDVLDFAATVADD